LKPPWATARPDRRLVFGAEYREAFKHEVEGFVSAATTPEAISLIQLFLGSRDIKKRALAYGLPADANPYTSRPVKQVKPL
jgi:hypothetical protein